VKTYLTAEEFEYEAAKLQEKCDRFISRVNSFLVKRMKDLDARLNEDQRDRVSRRFMARIAEKQRRIIHPGSQRFN
jgi:ribosomal protein S15P/S13E